MTLVISIQFLGHLRMVKLLLVMLRAILFSGTLLLLGKTVVRKQFQVCPMQSWISGFCQAKEQTPLRLSGALEGIGKDLHLLMFRQSAADADIGSNQKIRVKRFLNPNNLLDSSLADDHEDFYLQHTALKRDGSNFLTRPGKRDSSDFLTRPGKRGSSGFLTRPGKRGSGDFLTRPGRSSNDFLTRPGRALRDPLTRPAAGKRGSSDFLTRPGRSSSDFLTRSAAGKRGSSNFLTRPGKRSAEEITNRTGDNYFSNHKRMNEFLTRPGKRDKSNPYYPIQARPRQLADDLAIHAVNNDDIEDDGFVQ